MTDERNNRIARTGIFFPSSTEAARFKVAKTSSSESRQLCQLSVLDPVDRFLGKNKEASCHENEETSNYFTSSVLATDIQSTTARTNEIILCVGHIILRTRRGNLSWTCATTLTALHASCIAKFGGRRSLLSMVGRHLVNVINLCRA
jgi:hypothetical protein